MLHFLTLLVMAHSRMDQFEQTTLEHERHEHEHERTDLIPRFSSSRSYRLFSETRLPAPPTSRWVALTESPFAHWLCLAVKTQVLLCCVVVLIDDLYTIVIRSRMRTRESWVWPTQWLRTMIDHYRKRDWTNERTNDSNDSSWRTDRRKLIHPNESWKSTTKLYYWI